MIKLFIYILILINLCEQIYCNCIVYEGAIKHIICRGETLSLVNSILDKEIYEILTIEDCLDKIIPPNGIQYPFITELQIKNIKTIENNAFENLDQLEKLTITNSSELTTLSRNALNNLEVEYLNINGTGLHTIESGAFTSLCGLIELNLSGNSIVSFANGLFNKLYSLETLNIGSNKIQQLQSNIFKNLESLMYLDMSSNQLTYLPDELFQIDECILEDINLANNNIEHISQNIFKGLSFLKTLNLSQNKMKSIGTNAFDVLNHLQNLDLSGNNFGSNVSRDDFDNLPALTTLSLDPVNTNIDEVSSINTNNDLQLVVEITTTIQETELFTSNPKSPTFSIDNTTQDGNIITTTPVQEQVTIQAEKEINYSPQQDVAQLANGNPVDTKPVVPSNVFPAISVLGTINDQISTISVQDTIREYSGSINSSMTLPHPSNDYPIEDTKPDVPSNIFPSISVQGTMMNDQTSTISVQETVKEYLGSVHPSIKIHETTSVQSNNENAAGDTKPVLSNNMFPSTLVQGTTRNQIDTQNLTVPLQGNINIEETIAGNRNEKEIAVPSGNLLPPYQIQDRVSIETTEQTLTTMTTQEVINKQLYNTYSLITGQEKITDQPNEEKTKSPEQERNNAQTRLTIPEGELVNIPSNNLLPPILIKETTPQVEVVNNENFGSVLYPTISTQETIKLESGKETPSTTIQKITNIGNVFPTNPAQEIKTIRPNIKIPTIQNQEIKTTQWIDDKFLTIPAEQITTLPPNTPNLGTSEPEIITFKLNGGFHSTPELQTISNKPCPSTPLPETVTVETHNNKFPTNSVHETVTIRRLNEIPVTPQDKITTIFTDKQNSTNPEQEIIHVDSNDKFPSISIQEIFTSSSVTELSSTSQKISTTKLITVDSTEEEFDVPGTMHNVHNHTESLPTFANDNHKIQDNTKNSQETSTTKLVTDIVDSTEEFEITGTFYDFHDHTEALPTFPNESQNKHKMKDNLSGCLKKQLQWDFVNKALTYVCLIYKFIAS